MLDCKKKKLTCIKQIDHHKSKMINIIKLLMCSTLMTQSWAVLASHPKTHILKHTLKNVDVLRIHR